MTGRIYGEKISLMHTKKKKNGFNPVLGLIPHLPHTYNIELI